MSKKIILLSSLILIVGGILFFSKPVLADTCDELYQEHENLITQYDQNGDHYIDATELLSALNDWKDGLISLDDILVLLAFWQQECGIPKPNLFIYRSVDVDENQVRFMIGNNGGASAENFITTVDLAELVREITPQEIESQCPSLRCPYYSWQEQCRYIETQPFNPGDQKTYTCRYTTSLKPNRWYVVRLRTDVGDDVAETNENDNVLYEVFRTSAEGEEDPVTGTLSSDKTQAKVGENITLTVSAQDDQGVYKVSVWYHGSWHSKYCNDTKECTKTWTFTESTPGTRYYYGYVYGRKLNGRLEGRWTTPKYVRVEWEEVVSTCTDSDGGKNYYVKGTARLGNITRTDYCKDANTVAEYWCSGMGGVEWIAGPEYYQCPYGCENGACRRISPCDSYGDVTGDGYVTQIDVSECEQYIGDTVGGNLFKSRCDVNGDGIVNVLDITLIERYIEGLDNTFPVCQEKLPDLVVTTISLTPNNRIQAVIKNIGNATANASYATLYKNGTPEDTNPVASLAPEKTKTEYFDWSCSPGVEYNLKVCVDVYNTITESNEENNCFEATLTCPSTRANEDPVTGWLEVAPVDQTAEVGETIQLIIGAQDDQGVYKVMAYYKGKWHSQYCNNQTSCTKTWTFTETTPGIKYYYGYVYGRRLNGRLEGKYTSPSYVKMIITEKESATSTVSSIKNMSSIVASLQETLEKLLEAVKNLRR